MKNRIYVLPKAGQPRGKCQCSSVQWLMKNRIYVQTKAGQPRGKCQCSVANEKSNLRTL